MNAYAVTFSVELGRMIQHLPPALKRDIRDALRKIVADPNRGKELREDLAGLRSWRVGKYRIIYRRKRRRIEVIAVGPRRFIYEGAALAIKRARDEHSGRH